MMRKYKTSVRVTHPPLITPVSQDMINYLTN
uniref:Uncharacterized protein n=1 Tax=Dulem virus 42 TaxID=3145760 RepID=A0AAU8B8M1_9CAUD